MFETLRFSTFIGGIKSCTPVGEKSLMDLVQDLKTPSTIKVVKELQGELDKDKQEVIKLKLPYFTPTGTYSYRNDRSILHRNSFVLPLDIDSIKDNPIENPAGLRDHLAKQKGCLLVFVSPRGKGVKALFVHRQLFDVKDTFVTYRDNRENIAKCLGIEQYTQNIDTKQFTLSQAMFYSYDPAMYFNYTPGSMDIKFIAPIPPPPTPKLIEGGSYSNEVEQEILRECKDLCTAYSLLGKGDNRHKQIAKVKGIAGLLLQYKDFVSEGFSEQCRRELLDSVNEMYKGDRGGNQKNSFNSAWDTAERESSIDIERILQLDPKVKKVTVENPPAKVVDSPATKVLDPRAYKPIVGVPPAVKDPVLCFNGATVLTYENTSMLVASYGSGKSSVCEAICSNVVNPLCDSLGFSTLGVDRVLFIDCERTDTDVYNGLLRINRRAGVTVQDKAILYSMNSINSAKERREQIELLCSMYSPQLLVIDGAGDLCDNTNDLEGAKEVKLWFRSIAKSRSLSILVTIHPNPSTTKPRGHIGTELLQEVEGSLLIRESGNNREITPAFMYGKVRNDDKKQSVFITWDKDKEKDMFVTVDKKQAPKNTGSLKLQELPEQDLKNLLQKAVPTMILKGVLQDNLISLGKEYTGYSTSDRPVKEFVSWLIDTGQILESKEGRNVWITPVQTVIDFEQE